MAELTNTLTIRAEQDYKDLLSFRVIEDRKLLKKAESRKNNLKTAKETRLKLLQEEGRSKIKTVKDDETVEQEILARSQAKELAEIQHKHAEQLEARELIKKRRLADIKSNYNSRYFKLKAELDNMEQEVDKEFESERQRLVKDRAVEDLETKNLLVTSLFTVSNEQ